MIGVIAASTPYVTTSAISVVNTRKLKVIDMKQTLEEAAHSFAESRSSGSAFPAYYQGFIAGAEWQKDISSAKWQSKQSPWISVEDAIPNKQAKGMCQVKFVDGSIDEMAMREVNKWIYPYIKTGYVTHWRPI